MIVLRYTVLPSSAASTGQSRPIAALSRGVAGAIAVGSLSRIQRFCSLKIL